MDTYKQRQHDRLDRLTAVAHKLIDAGHDIDMINPVELGPGAIYINPANNPEATLPHVEHAGDTPDFTHWKARFDGVDVLWCRRRKQVEPQAEEVAA